MSWRRSLNEWVWKATPSSHSSITPPVPRLVAEQRPYASFWCRAAADDACRNGPFLGCAVSRAGKRIIGAFRRADVCSTCHRYLKSVAVLAPLSLEELLGTDLATAALDLAAVERGFRRA